jgi:hypothetical protein
MKTVGTRTPAHAELRNKSDVRVAPYPDDVVAIFYYTCGLSNYGAAHLHFIVLASNRVRDPLYFTCPLVTLSSFSSCCYGAWIRFVDRHSSLRF